MSALRVVHLGSNEDLPKSVLAKIPDAAAQTIFRTVLNEHLSGGKSEVHSYIKAYRALEDSGYRPNADEVWEKTGGPTGVDAQQKVGKLSPTVNAVHVPRPMGSDEQYKDKDDEEKDDDPGTQDVNPPEAILYSNPSIEDPDDERNARNNRLEVAKKISGSSQIPLNQKGVSLAKKLAKRIQAKGGLDLLYSSPLARGVETAHEILEQNPQTTYAKPEPALQPWHLGACEGKEGSDVKSYIHYLIMNPDEVPAGKGADGNPGESFNTGETRQLDFWKKLYDDFEADPTLKIGVVCHGRGMDLLQAAVDAGFPDDWKVDQEDLIDPDDKDHADMLRWHKDKIKEVDLDDDEPFKPGIYPIIHSLTNDDTDDGNKQLKKVEKYLPPAEVHEAAFKAYSVGMSVIGITAPLAEGEGLTEHQIFEIHKHFLTTDAESEAARNAWGGYHARKWADRVMKKAHRDDEAVWPSWIGFDLDNTLAEQIEDYGTDNTRIGNPKSNKATDRLKQCIKENKPARIFTARVAHDPEGKARQAIEQWTERHFGKKLPVTCTKDPGMKEFWDDKSFNPNIEKSANGVMVAFCLDPDIAQKLAIPGGVDPDQMHMTLLYLGRSIPTEEMSGLELVLKKFASEYGPVEGDLGGPVRFIASNASDGKDVCVAMFCNQTIQDFRRALCDAVETLGIVVSKNFSYTPHVTLKYLDTDEPLPVQRIPSVCATFTKLSLCIAGARKDYDLTGVRKAGDYDTHWVTIDGQHVLIGADGKPVAGNPKVTGRQVSNRVELARKSAILCGVHEQKIADDTEAKVSKAIGIPRTRNNSAFDLRNDEVGIELKTMITGKNEKITMSKTALGRKLAEAQAEGLKTFTVVADMRGDRSKARYYVSDKLGSLRLGSMTPVSLTQLKEIVKSY